LNGAELGGFSLSEKAAILSVGTRKVRKDGGGFFPLKKLTANTFRYAASTPLLWVG
jgi:hypothetical protein